MNCRQYPVSATRGSVLLYLIAVMTIVGVLAAAMLKLSVTSRETLFSANSMNQAQFLADSGLRIAQSRYCSEGELETPVTITLTSGEEVRIESDETHFRATATVFGGTPLEARAEAIGLIPDCSSGEPVIPGDSPDDYVLYSGGGVFMIPSHSEIYGSVFAQIITTDSGIDVAGNVISETSITIASGSNMGGFVCAANGNITMRSDSTVVGGNIYAPFGDVTLGRGTIGLGDVFAAGKVILESGGTVIEGGIHVGKDVVLESQAKVMGNIFTAGNVELKHDNALVGGDIHAHGNFSAGGGGVVSGNVYVSREIKLIDDSRIAGDAHAGTNILFVNNGNSITGNSYAKGNVNQHNGSIYNTVLLPEAPLPVDACPPAPTPEMQTFTPGTKSLTFTQFTSISESIVSPGAYNNLNFGGGSTVTLQASNCIQADQPCYVFQSFGPANWGQTLRLDLSTGDYITVFVKGDFAFSGPILVKTNDFDYTKIEDIPAEIARELARRVYWETHGKFSITSTNGTRRWFGTVLSEDNISLAGNLTGVGKIGRASCRESIMK